MTIFRAQLLCTTTVLIYVVLGVSAANAFQVPVRPNIIHIFADDLGYGSVGFTNPNTHIETPNLDAMAQGGMRLTRSYAATVCSPSRANLLTGFHSGHSENDRNANLGDGLRAQDVTVGEILQAANYRTAVLGKWGWSASGNRNLGGPDQVPTINDPESLPANQGYEIFFGFLNHAAAHDYYYDFMWQSDSLGGPAFLVNNDNGPGNSPEYTHDLVHLRSEELIRDLSTGDDPFYLQLSYTIPHFDLDQIQSAPAHFNLAGQQIFPAGLAQYNNRPDLTFREELHAAMISRMDASIGAVLARLEDPNFDGDTSDSILENTIVFFTSDNGSTPEDGLGRTSASSLPISGGLRGGKRDLYEGGIRMPAIAYWPGTIAAGSSTDLINGLSDFQATAADLAGTQPRVGVDGVSIVPTLVNQPGQQLRNYLIFESHANSQFNFANADWAVIQQDYKLIRFDNGNFELYRVDLDPQENNPLNLNTAANAAIRDQLTEIAILEGASQPDDYAVQFRQWAGSDNDLLTGPDNWEVTDDPANTNVGSVDETWSAVVFNASSSPSTVMLDRNVDFLGIELGGVSEQAIELMPGTRIRSRNGIRVSQNGALDMLNATLQTNRRVDISADGRVQGAGLIIGDVFNNGVFMPVDSIASFDAPDAGQFDFDVDFSGISNVPNKDSIFTPLVGNIPQAVISVDYGSSANSALTDRNFNDFPNEFNLQRWSTGGQLTDAINGGNFFNLTITPAPGLAVELVDVGFEFWRNGNNSPNDYGILTNVDGFDAGSVLGQLSVDNTNSVRLDASGSSGLATEGGLEIRLYGWNANQTNGHTHITGVDVELLFTDIPVNVFPGIEIVGDFNQSNEGQLSLALSNMNAGSLLTVSGTANLDGSLRLELANDFVPAAGEEFVLMTADTINGQFQSVEIVSDNLITTASLTTNAENVSVLFEEVCLPGDVNRDGTTDFFDISPFIEVLSANAFQCEADIDGDGVVDFFDISPFIALLAGT